MLHLGRCLSTVGRHNCCRRWRKGWVAAGGVRGYAERGLLRLRVLMRLGWFACFFRLCGACARGGDSSSKGANSSKDGATSIKDGANSGKDGACYWRKKRHPQSVATQTLQGHVHKAFEGSIEDAEFGRHIDADGRSSSRYRENGVLTGTAVVELTKKDGCGLGLVVSGGIDKNDRPRVSYLRPGGIAHRSDALEVGDYIVSVNGIRTAMLRHDEIIGLLKNAGDAVTIEVEYELPEPPQTTFSVICKTVGITLEKEGGSFGFTLRGGSHHDPSKCRPLTVTQIRPGSTADREGTLKIGDRILAINGVNVSGSTLGEAMMMLRNCEHDVLLLVEYDVSVMEAVQNATGPLLVEIDKSPGCSLGITLATTIFRGKPIMCINSIRPASIADRCGALHVGDHILSIDDTSLEHMTVAEATQLLKCSIGEQIRLEIVPVGHTKASSRSNMMGPPSSVSSQQSMNSLNTFASYNSHTSMQTNVGSAISGHYGTLGSRRGGDSRGAVGGGGTLERHPGGSGSVAGGSVGNASSMTGGNSSSGDMGYKTGTWGRRQRTTSNGSLASLSGPPSSTIVAGHTVVHTEETEVTLVADHRHKDYGLTITDSIFATDGMAEPPLISHIQPNSVAERCGILQEGDRLLAINGEYLENRTLDDVNRFLRESAAKVTLHIEFDVADSVVPSTGVYSVKLAKRGAGLGITISSPSNRQQGDPLIIADIKKGSVTHRTGTIQPGDKLLAIDTVRMDTCTIEDAAQVLQNAADIVRLRIRKDEAFADEPDQTFSITYTVELEKYGGQLGITISGTEEPFDPIVISGLTEGGLAEKTGAIHVNDRILAINGVSLRGKALSDAISMLQNCRDTVMLKITRATTRQYSNGSKSSINGKSVDSALESWDSSGLESNNHHKSNTTLKSSGHNNSGDSRDSRHDEREDTPPPPPPPDYDRPPAGTYDDLSQKLHVAQPHPPPLENGLEVLRSISPGSSASQEDFWSRNLDCLEYLSLHPSDTASFTSHPQSRPPDFRSRPMRHPLGRLSTLSDNGEEEELGEQLGDGEQLGEDEDFTPSEFSVDTRNAAEHHLREVEEELQNIFTPTPVELLRVTLIKPPDQGDFGFGLSDGVYEKGVYISALRPGGPGETSGFLRPYDRILQVNHVKTKELDCSQVVPLIAQAGRYVHLVLSRNPLALTPTEYEKFDDQIWERLPPPPPELLAPGVPIPTEPRVTIREPPVRGRRRPESISV